MCLRRTRNREDYIMKSFMICNNQILFGDPIMEEVGGARGLYVGVERCIQSFDGET